MAAVPPPYCNRSGEPGPRHMAQCIELTPESLGGNGIKWKASGRRTELTPVRVAFKFQYLTGMLMQIRCMSPGFKIKNIYNIIHVTIYSIKYKAMGRRFSTTGLVVVKTISLLNILPFCAHYCVSSNRLLTQASHFVLQHRLS